MKHEKLNKKLKKSEADLLHVVALNCEYLEMVEALRNEVKLLNEQLHKEPANPERYTIVTQMEIGALSPGSWPLIQQYEAEQAIGVLQEHYNETHAELSRIKSRGLFYRIINI